jgi:NAD(P)-dependent dehydrogenase (short-subunit alcohol dehydrogenase family)
MGTPVSRPLALITGASTGIGLELAKQFASNGFDLAVSARSDALDDAVRELEPLGGVVEPIRVDLASAAGVDQLWGRVQELGRPLAAAALNAGRGAGGAFTDTKVGADDKDDPADVARDGFEAMMAGNERVVSASLSTKVMGRAGRFVPDSVKVEQHRKMAEPGSARTS